MRLRGAVLWLVVMSALFAAGCAVGVFFGWRYALYVSSRPSTPLQSRALRLAQINVLEKGMLAIGFVLLGRALWRYGSALKRARVGPSSADVESNGLLACGHFNRLALCGLGIDQCFDWCVTARSELLGCAADPLPGWGMKRDARWAVPTLHRELRLADKADATDAFHGERIEFMVIAGYDLCADLARKFNREAIGE